MTPIQDCLPAAHSMQSRQPLRAHFDCNWWILSCPDGSGQLSTAHDLAPLLALSAASCASPRQRCGRPASEGKGTPRRSIPPPKWLSHSVGPKTRIAARRSAETRMCPPPIRLDPRIWIRPSELRSCTARANAASRRTAFSFVINKVLELDAERGPAQLRLGDSRLSPRVCQRSECLQMLSLVAQATYEALDRFQLLL